MTISTINSQTGLSEVEFNTLKDKVQSLEYLSRTFHNYLNKTEYLKTKIAEFADFHQGNESEVTNRLEKLKESFDVATTELKDTCNERYLAISESLQPYLQDPADNSNETKEKLQSRIISLMSKIGGIENLAKRVSATSSKIAKDHLALTVAEKKQSNAIDRFEEATRVLALTHDIQKTDERYYIVNAPLVLLVLSMKEDVSDYYKHRLKELQQRMANFSAQIRFNNDSAPITNPCSSVSNGSLMNGEISKCPPDPTEIPPI